MLKFSSMKRNTRVVFFVSFTFDFNRSIFDFKISNLLYSLKRLAENFTPSMVSFKYVRSNVFNIKQICDYESKKLPYE